MMKFVANLAAAVMLMGIMGCTTPEQPEFLGQGPEYSWEVKISRAFMQKKGSDAVKKIFFFNWTLTKVSGDLKEKIKSMRMVASYEHPAVFSKKDHGKKVEAIFSVKETPDGAGDIATCEFNIVVPRDRRKYVLKGERIELIPNGQIKPLVIYFPQKSKTENEFLDKID